MSVSTTINTVEFTGDGNDNSPYSFPYPLQADADIEIRGVTVATGVEVNSAVPLTLTTDYTVSRATDNSTATITLVTTTESDACIATGVTMVVKRVQTQKQESTYTDDGGAPGDRFEQDLDDLTLQIQSLQDQVDRSIKVDLTQPLADIGNLTVGTLVDNAGAPVVVNATEDGFGVGTTVEGQVIGPDSATDNAVARFDTTTGEKIQNSGVIVDDSDNMTGVTTLDIGATIAITGMLDEDNMASDSATAVATQQSIKKYVDDTVGAQDHGSLSGLADDDHTQYSLVDGTRAFTGTVTIGTGNLAITGGGITANVDADQSFTFGRCLLDSRVTDIMFLSHVDMSTANQRALTQSATGSTTLNSASGQTTNFLIDGTPVGGFTASLFTSNVAAQFDLDVDIQGDLDVNDIVDVGNTKIRLDATFATNTVALDSTIRNMNINTIDDTNNTTIFINPGYLSGGSNQANVDLFRNTNTSGTRRFRIFKGDNTATAMFTVLADTGNTTVGGDFTVSSGGETFLNLPVSAGTSGSLWNDSGTVKVA